MSCRWKDKDGNHLYDSFILEVERPLNADGTDSPDPQPGDSIGSRSWPNGPCMPAAKRACMPAAKRACMQAAKRRIAINTLKQNNVYHNTEVGNGTEPIL